MRSGGGDVQTSKSVIMDAVHKTILPDSPYTSIAEVEATVDVDLNNEITPTSQQQTIFPALGKFFASVVVKGMPDWDGTIV